LGGVRDGGREGGGWELGEGGGWGGGEGGEEGEGSRGKGHLIVVWGLDLGIP